MPRISAVILTKNEEEMLPRCLSRLSWADEIIVIDSFSTDRTVELAQAAGARVLQHPFTDFASQLNYGMEQATGDWLFMIDADELADADLCNAVQALLAGPEPEYEIYQVRRDSVVFGQPLRSRAWSNEWRPRLLRRGRLRYVGAVHSSLEPAGLPEGRIASGRLLHYTYRSTASYFDKFQTYSTLWAEKARTNGRHSGLAKACAAGAWRVFHNYVIRRDFLDGRLGLMLSLLAGMHTFVRHIKLWGLDNAASLARVDDNDSEPNGNTGK